MKFNDFEILASAYLFNDFRNAMGIVTPNVIMLFLFRKKNCLKDAYDGHVTRAT